MNGLIKLIIYLKLGHLKYKKISLELKSNNLVTHTGSFYRINDHLGWESQITWVLSLESLYL